MGCENVVEVTMKLKCINCILCLNIKGIHYLNVLQYSDLNIYNILFRAL